MIFVTGGAGFIGTNFILEWIMEEKSHVVNFDKLTLSGNLNNLSQLEYHPSYHFVKGDIRNRALVHETLRKYRPKTIIHCAAEAHREKSTQHPESLIQANIMGTFDLLEETLSYWKQLNSEEQKLFRFLYISTDEVYGQAPSQAALANEENPCLPSTIFAASKASAEHLVESYYHSFGLPTLIVRCHNNFGPYQFPNKLIPLTILNALQGNQVEVYENECIKRSWIYVIDNCSAIRLILLKGATGEIYNIGNDALHTDKEIVQMICSILDQTHELSNRRSSALIKLVKDKFRENQPYILDCTKLKQLGWQPKETFENALHKTVQWYLQNVPWIENIVSGEYRTWIIANYNESAVL